MSTVLVLVAPCPLPPTPYPPRNTPKSLAKLGGVLRFPIVAARPQRTL